LNLGFWLFHADIADYRWFLDMKNFVFKKTCIGIKLKLIKHLKDKRKKILICGYLRNLRETLFTLIFL
jgi:hypothetical protein